MKKRVLSTSFLLLVLWGLGGSVEREREYGRIKEGGLEKVFHQEERSSLSHVGTVGPFLPVLN